MSPAYYTHAKFKNFHQVAEGSPASYHTPICSPLNIRENYLKIPGMQIAENVLSEKHEKVYNKNFNQITHRLRFPHLPDMYL